MYARKTGSAVGQMFFAGFGTLWMTGWCLQRHGLDWSMLALIVIAGSTLFLWAWCDFRVFRPYVDRHAEPAARKARTRAFRWINAVQWLAVFAANFVLNAMGRPDWVTPAVILIIGLHLIPLARLFRAPRQYVTGLALIVVALAYPWMGGGGLNYPAGEFATGAILWISTLYGFLRGHLGDASAVMFERQQVLANEVQ
jgi:hypothetical protein